MSNIAKNDKKLKVIVADVVPQGTPREDLDVRMSELVSLVDTLG
jgi:hypothetical protein